MQELFSFAPHNTLVFKNMCAVTLFLFIYLADEITQENAAYQELLMTATNKQNLCGCHLML